MSLVGRTLPVRGVPVKVRSPAVSCRRRPEVCLDAPSAGRYGDLGGQQGKRLCRLGGRTGSLRARRGPLVRLLEAGRRVQVGREGVVLWLCCERRIKPRVRQAGTEQGAGGLTSVQLQPWRGPRRRHYGTAQSVEARCRRACPRNPVHSGRP